MTIAVLPLLAFLGSLTIRHAEIDVTPNEALPLGGYTERQGKLSEPGGDSLFVRVIVLQHGDLRVAVGSAEMLTIPESLVREVRKLIPADVKLFLAATHTHCAPDSQMLNDRMTFSVPGIATFKRRRLEWMSGRIAEAVNSALHAPAANLKLRLGWGHLDSNHTRRPIDVPDQSLYRLEAGSAPLLWQYAAHPVYYGPDELHTRGDWPGALSAIAGGIVLLGAIGDVSPNMDGRARADQIRDFAAAAQRARMTALPMGDQADLRWVEEPIALGPPKPHPGFAKSYHVPDVLAQLAVSRFAPPTASISALRLGKLAVVGVPGEPTAALGRRIRDAGLRLGFSAVLVTSHVNGWIGYILEPDDYDRGGYEATLAMHGREAGMRVAEAAVEALKKLCAKTPSLRSRESAPRSAR